MHLTNLLYKQLFYRRCLLCKEKICQEGWFCPDCYSSLPKIIEPCAICSTPTNSARLCGHCMAQAPYFDNSVVPFLYAPPISHLVHQFKYLHRFYVGKMFADLITKKILKSNSTLPELIIPLPMHPKKLRQRGYNQSALIAKRIANNLAVPFKADYLIRTKYTQPQVELTRIQRELAVKNAFKLKQDVKKSLYIALVDDVVSTSYTVNQACKALKNNGTDKISVWAIARNTI